MQYCLRTLTGHMSSCVIQLVPDSVSRRSGQCPYRNTGMGALNGDIGQSHEAYADNLIFEISVNYDQYRVATICDDVGCAFLFLFFFKIQ